MITFPALPLIQMFPSNQEGCVKSRRNLSINVVLVTVLLVFVIVVVDLKTALYLPPFEIDKNFGDLEASVCGRFALDSRVPIRLRSDPFRLLNAEPIEGPRPWIVYFQSGKDNGREGTCTGVLVNILWVVTVASCFTHMLPLETEFSEDTTIDESFHDDFKKITIELGRTHNIKKKVAVNISKIIVHGGFRPTGDEIGDDIAMVKLSKPVTYQTLTPICFPPRDYKDSDVYGAVGGFGIQHSPDKACWTSPYGPMKFHKCETPCYPYTFKNLTYRCKLLFTEDEKRPLKNVSLYHLHNTKMRLETCYWRGPEAQYGSCFFDYGGIEHWGFCQESCHVTDSKKYEEIRVHSKKLNTKDPTIKHNKYMELTLYGVWEKPKEAVYRVFGRSNDGNKLLTKLLNSTRDDPPSYMIADKHKGPCIGDVGDPFYIITQETKTFFTFGRPSLPIHRERAILLGLISRFSGDCRGFSVAVRIKRHTAWIAHVASDLTSLSSTLKGMFCFYLVSGAVTLGRSWYGKLN